MSSVQKSCPHFWHLWLGRAGVSTDPRADKWGGGGRVGEPTERQRERNRIVVGVFMREKGEERSEKQGVCVSVREKGGEKKKEKRGRQTPLSPEGTPSSLPCRRHPQH